MQCPKCSAELEKAHIKGKRNIYQCPKENTLYRLKKPRKERSNFDPNDSSTWTARCSECGGTMHYYNLKYGCDKCGNVLYV